MAFVARKPQAHERFGGGAGAAVLFASWMVRWPMGEAAVVVLWLSQWNRAGPRARSR
jgi:hypothetical protein